MRRWVAALALALVPLVGASPAWAAAPSFAQAKQTSVGTFPLEVAVGDFNGDGWPDVVAADMYGSSLSVLINDHNGGFTRTDLGPFPLIYAPSGTPTITSVAVGDLNGDGKADIVFATYMGEYVGVLLGNGDGTFQPLKPFNINPGHQAFPDSVAIGDMNGDGKPDVVVVRGLDNSVQTLLGNGDGTFTRGPTHATGGSVPDQVELGDLNGDGHLDAVVANNNSNSVSVIFGDGTGGWSGSATYPVTGISGNNPSPGDNPLAIGDVDGDGHPDIVVPGNHTTGVATVLHGDGAGHFTASSLSLPPVYPWGVAIADFNGDHIPDLAFAAWGDVGVVLPGLAGGGFGPAVYTQQHDVALGLAVADFNRDGRPDLAVANAFTNHVSVLLNTTAPPDATPPQITPVLTPATPDGANGWYRGNVTLTWNVSEPEAPSSLVKTGCQPQSITGDQPMTTYSCSATSQGGSAGPVTVTIGRDATAPTITGSVLPAAPDGANGWYVTAPTVTWTCSDATSGVASCTTPTTASTDGRRQTITGTATDRAGNSASATLTLNVDQAPPAITATQRPAANANGWNNSDVTVSFTCSDPISQVATCTGPSTLTTEGHGQAVTGTAVNNAGNSATTTAMVNIDKTPPTITASASVNGSPYTAGTWTNQDVTVTFDCADRLSGVANCSQPATVSSEGAHQSASGTATDEAGNSAGATFDGISIDKTPPTITLSGVTDGASYALGAAPTPSATVTDGLSGVATQSATLQRPTTASGAGTYVYTVTATDKAGNTATVTATYHVGYKWGGFLKPLPTDKPINGNRVLPVRFDLFRMGGTRDGHEGKYQDGQDSGRDANNQDGHGSDGQAVVWNAVATLYVNGKPAVSQDQNHGNRFEFTGGHYQYELDLHRQNLSAGPVTLTVKLDDGTTQSTVINLKAPQPGDSDFENGD
jgi:hypothetical protein